LMGIVVKIHSLCCSQVAEEPLSAVVGCCGFVEKVWLVECGGGDDHRMNAPPDDIDRRVHAGEDAVFTQLGSAGKHFRISLRNRVGIGEGSEVARVGVSAWITAV